MPVGWGINAGVALLHLSTVLQSCIYFVLIEINLWDKSSSSVCCLCIGGSSFIFFWGLTPRHDDGAPSMAGREQGLAARMAAVAQQMRSLHCLIHQSLLCAKLRGELKEAMDSVMAIIHFIRSTSSLQHRLFRRLNIEVSEAI